MYRYSLFLILAVLVCLGPARVRGEERSPLQDALALEEAMEKAIRDAEPAVACILVSRSNVYRDWFGEVPSEESPGKLGDFDPNRVDLQVPDGDRSQVEALEKEIAKKLLDFGTNTPEGELKKRFDLSDPSYVPESFGSGVVIDKGGLILTNYHVVREARKVYVRLPGGKGSYADIYAADPRSDLAVLQFLDHSLLPLPTIRRGDGGPIRKGQWVISLANPFAAGFRDGSPSASWGIVSNLRRRAPDKPSLVEQDRARLTLHHFGTLIQTDARLNLGCSGGALLNLKGELIGLTTALAAISGSETSGGFAIPLNEEIGHVIDVLAQGKEVEYGFLGVRFGTKAKAGEPVVVSQVFGNSPAFRAGLQPEDSVLEVNGVPVRENDDLFLMVGMHLAGTEVQLKVQSQERAPRVITVKLAKFDQPRDKIIVTKKRPQVKGLRVDYTSVLAQRDPSLGMIPNGVYVNEVLPNSPAANALLQGAVITRVNENPVQDPDEFYREVEKVKNLGVPLELTVAGRVEKVKLD